MMTMWWWWPKKNFSISPSNDLFWQFVHTSIGASTKTNKRKSKAARDCSYRTKRSTLFSTAESNLSWKTPWKRMEYPFRHPFRKSFNISTQQKWNVVESSLFPSWGLYRRRNWRKPPGHTHFLSNIQYSAFWT